MFDIFKNQYKRFFFLTESFFAVIVSIILHLGVVCLMLMQFTDEKKIDVNNFVVADLIDINEINNLLNKDLSCNEPQAPPLENKKQLATTSKKQEVNKTVVKQELQKTQPQKKSNPVTNTKKIEKTENKPKVVDNSKKNIAINQSAVTNEIDKKISYYIQLIQQEIAKNWKKPYAFNVSHPAIVRIKLNYEGNVVDINLLSSSSNRLYDESILQAIKDASPLESIKKMDTKTFIKNFTKIKLCFRPEDLD